MNIDGTHYRTIWLAEDGWSVKIIDQTKLPHRFEIATLACLEDAVRAIRDMLVRGAPLIGATAAYGVCLALREDASDDSLRRAITQLEATRPTAVNLRWALDQLAEAVASHPVEERSAVAYRRAAALCDDDVELSRRIGEHGLKILQDLSRQKEGGRVNVLTHCNAGWLATVDWGTALAPIYMAHDGGIDVHVWVDETRPRNQGVSLTAFELGGHGVPHTVVADNVGGHLMQQCMVDLCLVGTDRTSANGDVANKIGTYLKALAAHDNGVPFYVALPHTTIDWSIRDGLAEIPIEQREGAELTWVAGQTDDGRIESVEIVPPGTAAANFAFDVTPARLVTGLITDRGLCDASEEGLLELFPEQRNS